MERTVVALYDDLDTAQTAVQELLNNGFTRADVLVGFSESPENQAALIGVTQDGMSYLL